MKKLSFAAFCVASVLFLLTTANAQSKFAVGTKLDDFKLTDTNGKERSFNSLQGANGALIVFVSAQCPVVKMYNDRINALAAEYQAKGIAFIGINSNATESLEWVKSHTEENYKFPVLIDKGNVLADKLGASFTPETYFFDTKNVLMYHGAIDNDKYGKNIVDRHLKIAFDSFLTGKTIARNDVAAFGCTIKRAKEKE